MSNIEQDNYTNLTVKNNVLSKDEAAKLTPIPFNFNDIKDLATQLLKKAQEQAEQKLATARQQIAELEQDAYDKAYKEGFNKGKEDGFKKGEEEGKKQAEGILQEEINKEKAAFNDKIAPCLHILQEVTNIINTNKQDLLAQAESDLLFLSMDIARKIVTHELTTNQNAIRTLVQELIGLVSQRSEVVVKVSSEDFNILKSEVDNLKQIFPDLGTLKLQEDSKVERGGLIACTRDSEVDMQLNTRLAAFEQALLGVTTGNISYPWQKELSDVQLENLPEDKLGTENVVNEEKLANKKIETEESIYSPEKISGEETIKNSHEINMAVEGLVEETS